MQFTRIGGQRCSIPREGCLVAQRSPLPAQISERVEGLVSHARARIKASTIATTHFDFSNFQIGHPDGESIEDLGTL